MKIKKALQDAVQYVKENPEEAVAKAAVFLLPGGIVILTGYTMLKKFRESRKARNQPANDNTPQ